MASGDLQGIVNPFYEYSYFDEATSKHAIPEVRPQLSRRLLFAFKLNESNIAVAVNRIFSQI